MAKTIFDIAAASNAANRSISYLPLTSTTREVDG